MAVTMIKNRWAADASGDPVVRMERLYIGRSQVIEWVDVVGFASGDVTVVERRRVEHKPIGFKRDELTADGFGIMTRIWVDFERELAARIEWETVYMTGRRTIV